LRWSAARSLHDEAHTRTTGSSCECTAGRGSVVRFHSRLRDSSNARSSAHSTTCAIHLERLRSHRASICRPSRVHLVTNRRRSPRASMPTRSRLNKMMQPCALKRRLGPPLRVSLRSRYARQSPSITQSIRFGICEATSGSLWDCPLRSLERARSSLGGLPTASGVEPHRRTDSRGKRRASGVYPSESRKRLTMLQLSTREARKSRYRRKESALTIGRPCRRRGLCAPDHSGI
jgi:hypothetical protein